MQSLVRRAVAFSILAFILSVFDVHAEDVGGREHSFVLEVGPAGEWPLNGGRPNYGGTIAAEKEVIENWLELEFGVAALGTNGRRELSTDLVFKIPFHVSPAFEFMIGAGPEIARTVSGSDRRTSKSAEFALDFMFWPHENIGWFLEPTWSVTPATGETSLGMTGGLLIGF